MGYLGHSYKCFFFNLQRLFIAKPQKNLANTINYSNKINAFILHPFSYEQLNETRFCL